MFELFTKAIKDAINSIAYPASTPWALLLPRTKFDYAKEIGDGLGTNVIMAPVQWIMRTFPEAPVAIWKTQKDGPEKIINHPLIQRLNKPTPNYGGRTLWMATMLSWTISGNAYWLKERNPLGQIIGLRYIPHWMITPKFPADGSVYISHYEYNQGARGRQDIATKDIVHFRWGLNPRNTRLGLSPLASVLREAFADDEAANFSASMLRNMGVAGIMISPEGDVAMGAEDAKAVKERYKELFGGDNRGEAMIMSGPTKVQQFGFDPQKMSVIGIRDVAEERVCAVLGMPAAVVGFGSGLQQTKVGATMQELIKLAWLGNIIPSQELVSEELHNQLLPDFEPKPEDFVIGFDRNNIPSLQESADKKMERLDLGVRGGWVKVSEARRAIDLPVDDEDEIYLRPGLSLFETPEEKVIKAKAETKAEYWNKTLLENRIIASAPAGKPSAKQIKLINRLTKERRTLEISFAKDLLESFIALGNEAEAAAKQVFKDKSSKRLESKTTEDDIIIEQLLDFVNFRTFRKDMQGKYQTHYRKVAGVTAETLNTTLGLTTSFTDSNIQRILAAGGKRLGLIDFKKQARNRLFRELEEGRVLGETIPEIVERIKGAVPAGRWTDSATRAEMIARTEVSYAQRISSLEMLKEHTRVSTVMIMDARLGPTDAECEALNGKIVTLEEAEALMDDEHPNGTRDFVPVLE